MYASAQPLDFLAATKNPSFPTRNLASIHPEFPDEYELNTFVQTVAHDLHSPLTVFISGTELLRRLLDDLVQLAASAASNGHAKRSFPPLSSPGSLPICRNRFPPPASVWRPKTLPELQAHPTLIYQLFANLIGNAVRYAGGPEGPITIGGECTGNKVHFFVRDHGPGIPAEDKERLGGLFFRGENAGDHPGTGIGLAIVQKIASHYRGHLRVEDTPGDGATFWGELQKQAART